MFIAEIFKGGLFGKRIKKKKLLNKGLLNLSIAISVKLLKNFIMFKYIANPLILIGIGVGFKIPIYIFDNIWIGILLKLAKGIGL